MSSQKPNSNTQSATTNKKSATKQPAKKAQQKPRQQKPQQKPRQAKPRQPKSSQQAKKDTLRVIPLGGLDGIGKNMTVFEYGDDMLVVDAGLMFPDDDHPGIDLILPDYSYVVENEHKLRGIVVTHGHEDHTGALPWLLKDLSGRQVPIIATKLTNGIIAGKLEEHGVKNVKYYEVKAGQHLKRGCFGLDFITVNHSIPDAMAVALRTPVGTVLHTGDFKFDQTPIDGRVADFSSLARFGDAGVMLLMSDSTNAEVPSMTRSEASVGRTLKRIVAQAPRCVIVASFSSHIHRVQQICDAATAAGRKVAITGRSMLRNTKIARELGYLSIAEDDLMDAYNLRNYAPEDIVVLCTGSQGEPLSALARMATGEHKSVQIERGDTVILSATPVPGNERAVNTIVNQLTKIGARVYEKTNADVHVSGHGSAEDLKLMLNLVKPEYFMPIHGETRHLYAHKNHALEVGIPEEYIFILEDGNVLEFDELGARHAGEVPHGVIYVDGLNVGDMSNVVLRDRQHLSQDGIVTVVANVSRGKRRLLGEVEVVARGISVPDLASFQNDIAQRATRSLQKNLREGSTLGNARRAVREAVSQLLWEQTKTRPMVVPVIMDI